MSRLVSRILLTVFMLPAATVVYILTVISLKRSVMFFDFTPFSIAGFLTWGFVAGYWILLWRGSVRWNRQRISLTLSAAVGALVGAGLVYAFCGSMMQYDNGVVEPMIASIAGPMLWLIATVFIWREAPAERAERLNGAGRNSVVCPTCGYNLTGLSAARCPECGSQFTLDELLAAQPARVETEVEA